MVSSYVIQMTEWMQVIQLSVEQIGGCLLQSYEWIQLWYNCDKIVASPIAAIIWCRAMTTQCGNTACTRRKSWCQLWKRGDSTSRDVGVLRKWTDCSLRVLRVWSLSDIWVNYECVQSVSRVFSDCALSVLFCAQSCPELHWSHNALVCQYLFCILHLIWLSIIF